MAALFRRTKSPRDHQRSHVITTPTTSSAVEKDIDTTNIRRHKSEENIVIAIEPAIFNSEQTTEGDPPQLPPRNRTDSSNSTGGGGYRRTQSSGNTTSMSASFKATGHTSRKPQEDYFVPADTLRHLSNPTTLSTSPHSSSKKSNHEKRLMSMHDKIVSHNTPEFRASQKPLSRSFDKLVDNSDYSTPFDVLPDYNKEGGNTVIPPPKPKRTTGHKLAAGGELTGGTDPPNYLPPPPPGENEENTPEQERRNTMSPSAPAGGNSSPHSPSVTVTRGGDYDDPWDSNKFKRIRPLVKGDSSGELQTTGTTPNHSKSLAASSNHIDPYKSPRGSSNELSNCESTEPPTLPPKPSPSPPHTHTDHHHHHHNRTQSSPPPPPVPETARPRTHTGESDYCEPPDAIDLMNGGGGHNNNYVNSPSHVVMVDDDSMHDYVNQPVCPPKLPPRPKKPHGYPPLEPPTHHSFSSSSHPSDTNNPAANLPPIFPIDVSILLEEQP